MNEPQIDDPLLSSIMKCLLFTLLVVSTSASFLARVRNHWEEKTRKPECHIEFEDVTEPHCETSTEQVMRTECSHILLWSLSPRCVGRSWRTNARRSTAHRVRPSTIPRWARDSYHCDCFPSVGASTCLLSARRSSRSSASWWRESNVTQNLTRFVYHTWNFIALNETKLISKAHFIWLEAAYWILKEVLKRSCQMLLKAP